MFRLNRSRLLGIFCVVVLLYFLVFTDSGSSASEFRANTEAGLARKQQREQELPLRGHLSDEDLTKKTNDELQGILSSQSKEKMGTDPDGNTLGRQYQDSTHNMLSKEDLSKDASISEDAAVDGNKMTHAVEDVTVAGRKTMQKPKYPEEDEKSLKADAEDKETEGEADPGMAFAREKLTEYLKNPVVIFSKSFCPHSKKAKKLLLDIYNINPKPLVIELDMMGEHIPSSPADDHGSKKTLGKALQELLGEITGRKTVPNIMIGGAHSIGGNDKIWAMHEQGILAEEIKKFGGRKVIGVDVFDNEHEGVR